VTVSAFPVVRSWFSLWSFLIIRWWTSGGSSAVELFCAWWRVFSSRWWEGCIASWRRVTVLVRRTRRWSVVVLRGSVSIIIRRGTVSILVGRRAIIVLIRWRGVAVLTGVPYILLSLLRVAYWLVLIITRRRTRWERRSKVRSTFGYKGFVMRFRS